MWIPDPLKSRFFLPEIDWTLEWNSTGLTASDNVQAAAKGSAKAETRPGAKCGESDFIVLKSYPSPWTLDLWSTGHPKRSDTNSKAAIICRFFKISSTRFSVKLKNQNAVSGLAGRQKLARRQGLWLSEIEGVWPSGLGALMCLGQTLYSVIFLKDWWLRRRTWRIHPMIPMTGPFLGTNSWCPEKCIGKHQFSGIQRVTRWIQSRTPKNWVLPVPPRHIQTGNRLGGDSDAESAGNVERRSDGNSVGRMMTDVGQRSHSWQQDLAKLAAVCYQLASKKPWFVFWGDWQVVKKVCLCLFIFVILSFSIQIFWPDMASLECSKAAAQAGVCAAEAWDPDWWSEMGIGIDSTRWTFYFLNPSFWGPDFD